MVEGQGKVRESLGVVTNKTRASNDVARGERKAQGAAEHAPKKKGGGRSAKNGKRRR